MNITPSSLKTVMIGISTDITKTLREVLSEEPDMDVIEHYLIALASSTATIAMMIDDGKPVVEQKKSPPSRKKEPQHSFLADVENDNPDNEDPDIAREKEEAKGFFA